MSQAREYIKVRFLKHLRTGVGRTFAAAQVNTYYMTIWRWMQKDEAFKAKVEEAEAYSKHVKIDTMIVEGEAVVSKCLGQADLDLAFKAASLVLERHGGWVKPQNVNIGGQKDNPIETKDVTPKMSDNEAARRIALILAKGLNDDK